LYLYFARVEKSGPVFSAQSPKKGGEKITSSDF
jgi:hypothetical protein